MKPQEILFRCSRLGALMTNSRTKSEPLSETTKTYLVDLIGEVKYGIREEISSKQMDKGTYVEADGITLLSEQVGQLMVKNKNTYRNDYITGTPDILLAEAVVDIKSPYTWGNFAKAGMTKDYEWQLRGYMALTGKEVAHLAYCLVDLPEGLLYDEVKRAAYYRGIMDGSEEYDALEEQLRLNFQYGRIPAEKRVKIITIARDAQLEADLYERIEACRQWLTEQWEQL